LKVDNYQWTKAIVNPNYKQKQIAVVPGFHIAAFGRDSLLETAPEMKIDTPWQNIAGFGQKYLPRPDSKKSHHRRQRKEFRV